MYVMYDWLGEIDVNAYTWEHATVFAFHNKLSYLGIASSPVVLSDFGMLGIVAMPVHAGAQGYAFVNFSSPEWARFCRDTFHGTRLFPSAEGVLCEVSPARLQRRGADAQVARGPFAARAA